MHTEKHFTGSAVLRDIVIGMSDGLTVPFALAAGLSGAVDSTAVVITAGLAEIAAGSIAMGLGGFLAARSDGEHYASEEAREKSEVVQKTAAEEAEVAALFQNYGLTDVEISPIVAALKRKPAQWVEFMMRFELGLEKPDPRRAWTSALTIALAYVAGGLVPLAPYMFVRSAQTGLAASAVMTMIALAIFGYIKGSFGGVSPLRSAVQTVVIGGLAAGTAFAIARLISP